MAKTDGANRFIALICGICGTDGEPETDSDGGVGGDDGGGVIKNFLGGDSADA